MVSKRKSPTLGAPIPTKDRPKEQGTFSLAMHRFGKQPSMKGTLLEQDVSLQLALEPCLAMSDLSTLKSGQKLCEVSKAFGT